MRLPATIYWEWWMLSRWVALTLEVALSCIVEDYSASLLLCAIVHVLIYRIHYVFINCWSFHFTVSSTAVHLHVFISVLFCRIGSHPTKLKLHHWLKSFWNWHLWRQKIYSSCTYPTTLEQDKNCVHVKIKICIINK